MYENHTKSTTTSEHAPRGKSGSHASVQQTEPKFARQAFTWRNLQPWQTAGLVVAAVIVIGLILAYL
ncbi:ElaB/YqjD/DUF883 family membrane-anchored ribosome-binding protein [Natronocella acetinitrilica]|uniref:ElaB/YqjD/DUF883 family membrane-anchored ribosome-binding protein n=1 Tax=Natronocella acetinitrilica TaxID=414046 RepID=A0AAE3KH65_9GAMM|nr:hypothetical protein [Natronocella acetinitrilica]MCP1676027.1 ElaB/YqjD/DUF883 family membrane-anchored ribosome-binding protein [Natronocella acetinitrilica]